MLHKIVAATTFLIAVSGCTCSSFFREKEAVFAPTEVGTPEGQPSTKEIGPGGGELSSADGRLTLIVPPNALAKNVTFVIQPISNNSEGGVGVAYRLEPSGKVTNAPMQLTFKYNEKDLEGTDPQALRLAYQDEKRAWHQQNSVTIDTKNGRIIASTTHFSDWAPKTTYSFGVRPGNVVLRVGEKLPISAEVCEVYKPTLQQESKTVCRVADECSWTLQGPGTLSSGGPQLIYTAPARKGYATVVCKGRFWPDHESASGVNIRIIDRSFRATGQTADLIYGGTICSLYEPFNVYGKAGSFYYNFLLKPASSSGTSGTVDVMGSGYSATAFGRPNYTIEEIDSDTPRIAISGSVIGRSPAGQRTGSGTIYIDLVSFDTKECLEDRPPKPPWQPPNPDLRGLKDDHQRLEDRRPTPREE